MVPGFRVRDALGATIGVIVPVDVVEIIPLEHCGVCVFVGVCGVLVCGLRMASPWV